MKYICITTLYTHTKHTDLLLKKQSWNSTFKFFKSSIPLNEKSLVKDSLSWFPDLLVGLNLQLRFQGGPSVLSFKLLWSLKHWWGQHFYEEPAHDKLAEAATLRPMQNPSRGLSRLFPWGSAPTWGSAMLLSSSTPGLILQSLLIQEDFFKYFYQVFF